MHGMCIVVAFAVAVFVPAIYTYQCSWLRCCLWIVCVTEGEAGNRLDRYFIRSQEIEALEP